MGVIFGSARSDERGKAYGGKAGDQKNGKEVSTQAHYIHSLGWRVLRLKDPAMAERAAHQMQLACDSPLVGYDQHQRTTLRAALKACGYDIAQLKKAVETDCSDLIRHCLAYAFGRDIVAADYFNTANLCRVLLATGLFEELTGDRYTQLEDYLRRGDILCTRSKGHVVMVLTDGDKADADDRRVYALGERLLRNGCEGPDVQEMQELLIRLGYGLGKWGADADFGDATEMAVLAYQRACGLEADGVVGPLTLAAMEAAIEALEAPVEAAKHVQISGGDCYIRSAPGTDGRKLGVAKRDALLKYGGEVWQNGWILVEVDNRNGWVSGKYGRLVE